MEDRTLVKEIEITGGLSNEDGEPLDFEQVERLINLFFTFYKFKFNGTITPFSKTREEISETKMLPLLTEMKSNIPVEKVEFIEQIDMALYMAGLEGMDSGEIFRMVSDVLRVNIEIPEKDWEFEVMSLWSTIPVQFLRTVVTKYEDELNGKTSE